MPLSGSIVVSGRTGAMAIAPAGSFEPARHVVVFLLEFIASSGTDGGRHRENKPNFLLSVLGICAQHGGVD